MRIGGEYRVGALTARHWMAFAEQSRLDPSQVLARVDELAERPPAAFRAAAGDVESLGSSLPGRLSARVEEHVEHCRRPLAG